jgi:hypothetical protein
MSEISRTLAEIIKNATKDPGVNMPGKEFTLTIRTGMFEDEEPVVITLERKPEIRTR